MSSLENCAKIILKKYQYRNNKEYYKIHKDKILEIFGDCDNLITKHEENKKITKKIKYK